MTIWLTADRPEDTIVPVLVEGEILQVARDASEAWMKTYIARHGASPVCANHSPHHAWVCTRYQGHNGLHVGTAADRVVGIWGEINETVWWVREEEE